MAKIHPFRAWKPSPEFVQKFASVPYDVISTEEARLEIENNTHSFLRIVRPDAVVGDNSESQIAYAKNAFKELQKSTLIQSKEPSFFVYRISKGEHIQSGFFVCVDVADYRKGIIVKHEKTKPIKVAERSHHIAELGIHAEPVMMAFEDNIEVMNLLSEIQTNKPLFSFTKDAEIHELWEFASNDKNSDILNSLGNIYITDGHHRCESAHVVAEKLPSNAEAHRFPAVLFPFSQVRILPYNRVVISAENAFSTLKGRFELSRVSYSIPSRPHAVCAYVKGDGWFEFDLPCDKNDPVSQLDYSRLQDAVLTPLFGIEDPRTSKNIDFVGGSRGTKELENLVNSGKADIAFSLNATSIQELRTIADAGQLMPPKSTWFDPKVLSGLLIHEF